MFAEPKKKVFILVVSMVRCENIRNLFASAAFDQSIVPQVPSGGFNGPQIGLGRYLQLEDVRLYA